MFEATFIGGPRDGDIITLPDGTWELRVPVLMNPHDLMHEPTEAPTPLDIREHVLRIERRNYKYVIVWKEPRVSGPT